MVTAATMLGGVAASVPGSALGHSQRPFATEYPLRHVESGTSSCDGIVGAPSWCPDELGAVGAAQAVKTPTRTAASVSAVRYVRRAIGRSDEGSAMDMSSGRA